MTYNKLERQVAEQQAGLLPFKAVRSNVPEEKLRKRRVKGSLEISSVLGRLEEQENTVT